MVLQTRGQQKLKGDGMKKGLEALLAPLFLVAFMSGVMVFSGCSKTEKTLAGVAIGAGVGAGIGVAAGGGTGALVGASVGAVTGGIVGSSMGDDDNKRKKKKGKSYD